MTIIDRHVGATFIRSYVLLLLAGIGLYIFADVLANLDEFTENPDMPLGQILRNIGDYYLHNLALYYYQLGGVMLAIAAAFTFAIMLRSNEMTALVIAGMPLQRLAVPVLAGSVLLVGLWMANSELVIPRIAHKIARHPDDLSQTRSSQVYCVRDDRNAILTARELHSQQGLLKQVHIIEPDENGLPWRLIRADAAVYDPARRTWRLERGARQVTGPAFENLGMQGSIRFEPLDEYPFTLSPEQILLRQSSQWAELMSLRQMNTLLKSRNLPNLPAVAKSRDIRFTQPLIAWILMLLAIPFFLTREPANVLVAGGKALLLTGAAFVFTFMAHSVSTDPYTARLAAALPVLLFGPVAVLHFANLKT